MEKIFMNMESNKTSEPHEFVLSLLQRLDLRSSTKHVALQSIPIYYTWKNIRKHNKNNKLKIIASTTNDESELPDGSDLVSAIQDYIERIIKNIIILSANPLDHIYIDRINNRLVFKIKDGSTLELKTPEAMKLFASTKN